MGMQHCHQAQPPTLPYMDGDRASKLRKGSVRRIDGGQHSCNNHMNNTPSEEMINRTRARARHSVDCWWVRLSSPPLGALAALHNK